MCVSCGRGDAEAPSKHRSAAHGEGTQPRSTRLARPHQFLCGSHLETGPQGRPFPGGGVTCQAEVQPLLMSHALRAVHGRLAWTRQGSVCPLLQPRGQRERCQWEGGRGRCPVPSADRPRLLQRALAQMPDLRLVSTLEMCVDTREYTLGNFGESPCLSTPAPVRASSLEPCLTGSGLWTRAPHGPTLHRSVQGLGTFIGPGPCSL